MIVWSGHQTGNWQIYGVAFNQNGVALTNPVQVTNATNDQMYPDVALNDAGDVVLTWSGHQSSHWNVYGETYTPTNQFEGTIFQVNTNMTDDQEYSTVAMDAGSNFTITWSGHQTGHWNIYAQSYLANGAANGSNFQVNTTDGQDQEYSSIAFAGDGNPIITWSADGTQAGTTWGVYAQQFTATGTPLGNKQHVNTYTPGAQYYSSITGAANGDVAIVWTSQNEDGSSFGVYGQNFTTGATANNITVTPASLATSQTGTSATFGVVLTSAPAANVTIYLNSTDPSQGTLSASALTFTPANWNVAQNVTVTGLDDHIADGNQTYLINGTASSADPNFNGQAMPAVTVVNTQADVAGFTVTPTSLTTSATGSSAAFSVALTSEPLAPVTLSLGTTVAGQGALSQTTLTFDASNWDTAQTVTVTGEDNPLVSGNQTYQVTGTATSADGVYNGMAMTPVTVVNMQAVAGFTVTPTALQTTSAGAAASFLVVLTSEPTSTVTINLSSTNPAAGSLSSSALTFDAGNWNVAQTVMVTGLNDGTNHNQTYQINGTAASSDGNYNGLAMTPVTVTNFNAGSGPVINTSQSGNSSTFSISLSALPLFPVTVNLTNNNPAQGSLSQNSLTFTLLNWNVPQSVTVTGLNDHMVDGNQIFQITGVASSLDPGYNGLAMNPVTVINQGTDVAGINITGSTFLVSEDNNVLRINSLTGAVIATYPTNVLNDGAVFGPDGSLYVADYATNQILHFSATGTNLPSFGSGVLSNPQGLAFGPDGDLYVTNADGAVDKFSPTGTSLGTFIAAGTDGLTNAKAIVWGPDGNAYVSSYFNSEVIEFNATTGGFIKVFATGSGGFEDLTFGPDNNLYVASYGDNTVYSYNGITGAALGAFVSGGHLDNPYGLTFDPAGNLDVTSRSSGTIETFNGATGAFLGTLATGLTNPAYLSTTTSLVTSDTGTTATFTVSLTSVPIAPVTVNLATSVTGQGSLSQSSLTFDAADWNIAQTVTVTGLNDHIADGNQTYQITGTVTSADPNYNALTVAPVSVENINTNVAGFTVAPTSLTTSDLGTSATFAVALTSQPIAPVTINLGMSVAGQGSLSQSSLTFDADNWNIAQTVTVTGLDDTIVNGNQTYQITGAATSADSNYNTLTMTPVTVTNIITDVAGIMVTPTSLTTSDTGTSASFRVALTSLPTAPVTINLGMSVAGQGSLSQTSLTFDASDWDVAQTVTVTGLNDNIADGNQTYVITGTASSTDANYSALTMTPVSVTNVNTNVAGITVAPTSLTTSDTGTSASFDITLTSAPTSPVTIDLGTSVAGQGSLSQSSLTFDAGDWNVAQTVTITGLNDHIADGNQTYDITGTTITTDPAYSALTMAPVDVTNLNTNVSGITVTPTSLTTSDTGTSASFIVALTSARPRR